VVGHRGHDAPGGADRNVERPAQEFARHHVDLQQPVGNHGTEGRDLGLAKIPNPVRDVDQAVFFLQLLQGVLHGRLVEHVAWQVEAESKERRPHAADPDERNVHATRIDVDPDQAFLYQAEPGARVVVVGCVVGLHDAQAGRRGPFGQVGVGRWGGSHRVVHDLAGQNRSADLDIDARRHLRHIANHPTVGERSAVLGAGIRLASGRGRKNERQPRQQETRAQLPPCARKAAPRAAVSTRIARPTPRKSRHRPQCTLLPHRRGRVDSFRWRGHCPASDARAMLHPPLVLF
jgi:hypothetical protein